MCEECGSNDNRITPLHNPLACLKKHTQYICGTCGCCICIEHDAKSGLQRWNYPFSSLAIAKQYLRSVDYTLKKACGIYELISNNGRVLYKIFPEKKDLQQYLNKHKDKSCKTMAPVFTVGKYREYPKTQIRKLTPEEILRYYNEQKCVKQER